MFSSCRLVIAARTVQKLADTQSECLKNTPHVHTVRADVSKEEDCRAIVDKAVEEFGGVDILILNAAYSPNPQWFSDYEKPVSAWAYYFVLVIHYTLNKCNAISLPSHNNIIVASALYMYVGIACRQRSSLVFWGEFYYNYYYTSCMHHYYLFLQSELVAKCSIGSFLPIPFEQEPGDNSTSVFRSRLICTLTIIPTTMSVLEFRYCRYPESVGICNQQTCSTW